jgi:hypothetical protein
MARCLLPFVNDAHVKASNRRASQVPQFGLDARTVQAVEKAG